MHRRHLSTSSALAIGGSLAGLLAFSSMGMGAQGQPDFFLDEGGSGGSTGGSGGTGGGNNGGQGGNQGGSGGGDNQPSIADLTTRLTSFESQITTLTKERDDANKKVKTFEDGQKSDADKAADKLTNAEKERDTALANVKAANVTLVIEREARKLNIVDEDAAAKLIDMNAVQFDKDSKPTNIAVLLGDLIKAKPYLVKPDNQQATGGGGSNPARGRSGGGNDNVKPGLGRMRNAYANASKN